MSVCACMCVWNFFYEQPPRSEARQYTARFSSLDGGRPPFCVYVANFGMTHNENLLVFITVQNLVENLVEIALVVLIIQKFEYFARLA